MSGTDSADVNDGEEIVVERFPEGQTAVLCSGGLDSVVLLAHEAASARVVPLYVSVGLAWEPAERRALERLLRNPAFASVDSIVALELPMGDVYSASHWAVRGEPPAYDTLDEDVYIPGRNITLLAKAAVYCAPRGIQRIAIGPLAGNPFPDATPEFFEGMARVLASGLSAPLRIDAPFLNLQKSAVIRRGIDLGVPLELTLSCMNPQGDAHCGRCSKCRERQHAFRDAGVKDVTEYAAVQNP